LLQFARSLRARHLMPMQIGTVSEPGPVGRSGVDERYRECLLNSKIVLHANPDPWEGDARLWEALAAGALVCVDRMVQPIDYPLVDGEHVVFYDPTDEGLADLERRIIHFLLNEEERAEIAAQGRAFALAHHRSQNRIDAMVQRLLDRVDIGVEIGVEYGPGSGKSAQHEGARGDRSRLTAARQRA
jgi:hypothetical protein